MAKFHIMNFTPELLEHKKKYGDDWENHALKMISADEEEAKKGLFGYICPLCGLSYFFSDKSDAQEKADTMQEKHLKSCDRRLKNGKL